MYSEEEIDFDAQGAIYSYLMVALLVPLVTSSIDMSPEQTV